MRLLRRMLFTVLLILLLGVFALWGVLHTESFWRWAGGKVVLLAQEECHCAVRVGGIEGNIFDGLFFKDIVFATLEEEVIRAPSLEIRASLWSLLRLRPLITKVAILEPHLNIRQEEDGEWNIIKILPPPPTHLPVPVISVRFSDIMIIDGQGKITQGGQIQPFTNLDLKMDLDLDHPVTPRQALKVGKAMAAATTAFGRVSLTSSFTYTRNLIKLQHLEVKTGEKTLLSLVGEADLSKGGQFQVTGKLDLPPQEIHQAWEKWPTTWDAEAAFQAQGTRSQFHLSLTGKVQELAFDVAGDLGSQAETWNYDLQGHVKNLNPDLLAMFNKSLARKLHHLSPLDAKFQLQGKDFTFPPAQFSWSLETGPFQYGSAKMDRLKVALSGNRHNQQLQGSVESTIGQLSLNAAGSLFSAKDGKFMVQVDSFKPGPLGLGVPEGTTLTAKLDGNFSSPGMNALDLLKVSGVVEASGKIGPHPLSKVHVSLAWTKNKLEISQADVRLGNLTAGLRGALVGDKLDFSFQGKSAPGGNWPIPAEVGGQFSWEGTLTGRLADPQVALKARGRGLAYEPLALQTVSLHAQTSGWPPAKGRMELQATGVKTPVGVFSQANFQGDGVGKRWSFDLKAIGPENARVEVRGSADLGKPSVFAERALVRLKTLTAQNLGPLEIALAPGIEVKPVTFQINQGRVGLQARITDQQVSGSLKIENLAAEWFAPKSIPLTGVISGQATLGGTARLLVVQGDLRLGPARYRDFEVQTLRTFFSYQDNRLTLDGSLKTKDGGPTLAWNGQIPWRLSLMPFALAPGPGELKFLVQGDNVNLNLLPLLVKDVEEAQGALKVLAKIEGTIDQPRVSGQATWGAGFIKLRPAGATYQLQPGEIRLQGNRLSIPQLILKSDGTITVTGEVTLAGLLPDEVRARAQINNFKAIDKLGSQAFLNGAINLEGRWPNLTLKGNLAIPQASFRLSYLNLGPTTMNKDVVLVRRQTPEESQSPKAKKPRQRMETEAWKNLSVDLDIRAPKDVWISDRLAKIEVSVNVQVRKRPDQDFVSSGEINAIRGHVFIGGREFQVTRGMVTLPAHTGAEPMLNARIAYEANEVTLYADATGPVSNPKITLGGEPAISETDWMAYLLYGRPVASLSREEQSAVSAAGAFGGLATRLILKDLLGLAPPITKGLTISYQQRNDPLYRDNPYQVVIQYRINRRFSVQSQVGGRNTGGDVLFNYDF